MRTILVALAAIVMTPPCAAVVILAALFRIPERPGSIYGKIPRLWSKVVLRAAGVRVRVHNAERLGDGTQGCVYAANHVSWFDVFALAATLPRYAFVAKAELMRIPIFGQGARAIGTIPIERENRASAFASYDKAAAMVRAGHPVVVFPEGTRGRSYAIRPFKKGPFVLAIAAGVPIIPIIVHGTIDIMPKGSWRIRPGTIDLHVLEAVPTAGATYEDRDAISARVQERMAEAMSRLYG
jgi:1-acyl-sn-glycerol-3-phosphate acyltransferase